jgi:hypothetical protein
MPITHSIQFGCHVFALTTKAAIAPSAAQTLNLSFQDISANVSKREIDSFAKVSRISARSLTLSSFGFTGFPLLRENSFIGHGVCAARHGSFLPPEPHCQL